MAGIILCGGGTYCFQIISVDMDPLSGPLSFAAENLAFDYCELEILGYHSCFF